MSIGKTRARRATVPSGAPIDLTGSASPPLSATVIDLDAPDGPAAMEVDPKPASDSVPQKTSEKGDIITLSDLEVGGGFSVSSKGFLGHYKPEKRTFTPIKVAPGTKAKVIIVSDTKRRRTPIGADSSDIECPSSPEKKQKFVAVAGSSRGGAVMSLASARAVERGVFNLASDSE